MRNFLEKIKDMPVYCWGIGTLLGFAFILITKVLLAFGLITASKCCCIICCALMFGGPIIGNLIGFAILLAATMHYAFSQSSNGKPQSARVL